MKTTSFKLPQAIHAQVQERVLKEGLGLRGKNAWLVRAIENFLVLADYVEYVNLADECSSLDMSVNIRLNESVIDKLEKASVRIREVFPLMEGVQSKILRASIIQGLLR